jgi:MoaA/NifB/PqqE/SkfB family radical SAM enzyme
MMRFPLRLTADLTMARIAQKLRLAQGARPVQFVDAAEILHPDSSHPVSHEKIRDITGSRSPVVWIGGSEPLDHPGIAHLVRAITCSGHFVFLETDGILLRRRIHEFQPVSRLFLTVRLEPGVPRRTSSGLRPGASDLAMEGIRAARLSGFSICIQVRITPETEMSDAAELFHLAHSLDVDGFVISPARGEPNSALPAALTLSQKTAEARKLIGSIWWESFSRLVEPVLLGEPRSLPAAGASAVHLEHEASEDEEGIKVA